MSEVNAASAIEFFGDAKLKYAKQAFSLVYGGSVEIEQTEDEKQMAAVVAYLQSKTELATEFKSVIESALTKRQERLEKQKLAAANVDPNKPKGKRGRPAKAQAEVATPVQVAA